VKDITTGENGDRQTGEKRGIWIKIGAAWAIRTVKAAAFSSMAASCFTSRCRRKTTLASSQRTASVNLRATGPQRLSPELSQGFLVPSASPSFVEKLAPSYTLYAQTQRSEYAHKDLRSSEIERMKCYRKLQCYRADIAAPHVEETPACVRAQVMRMVAKKTVLSVTSARDVVDECG